MKQTINFSQFHDAFQSIRPDNFSYEGLRVLYDWFVDQEYNDQDGITCNEIELDVIAICCDFNESTTDEIIEDYSLESDFRLERRKDSPLLTDWRIYGDRETEELINYLNDQTMVCGQTDQGTIVYMAY